MEAKFTKGPWRVNLTGPHWNNPEIANYEICYSENGECIVDHVYEPADAHLIAVAPEMYEEIQRDIDHLERQMRFKTENDEMLTLLKQEQNRKIQLLAKARGEQ